MPPPASTAALSSSSSSLTGLRLLKGSAQKKATGISSNYAISVKPLVERLAAFVLLLALLPALALVWVVLLFVNRGRVFFRQERVGYQGRPFTIVKFRSSARQSIPGPNAHYTPLGKWLRRYHVDELPQLWNVLRGEMSLVGPRPLLASDLTNHADHSDQADGSFKRAQPIDFVWRHAVKPGLTGLVQVSGGKALPWAERFELDAVYVANVDLVRDWSILRATLVVSLGGKPRPFTEALTELSPAKGNPKSPAIGNLKVQAQSPVQA
jgi:lipopolysaccharide/colanic/teichoic acid biosynthesis glycosyltransferase